MNDAFNRQVQDLTRQTTQLFAAGQHGMVPESLANLAENAVSKSRELFDKVSVATQDNAKVAENVLATVQNGASSLGKRMLDNTVANADAAFEAARAIARARSVPEIASLQAEFIQQQLSTAAHQSKDMLELSTRIAQQTFEAMRTAASKSLQTFLKPN
ncbi:MAG: phasin family protein [Hyphomicrobium sp.]